MDCLCFSQSSNGRRKDRWDSFNGIFIVLFDKRYIYKGYCIMSLLLVAKLFRKCLSNQLVWCKEWSKTLKLLYGILLMQQRRIKWLSWFKGSRKWKFEDLTRICFVFIVKPICLLFQCMLKMTSISNQIHFNS